jgi:hypothetical protein
MESQKETYGFFSEDFCIVKKNQNYVTPTPKGNE